MRRIESALAPVSRAAAAAAATAIALACGSEPKKDPATATPSVPETAAPSAVVSLAEASCQPVANSI